jgi:hypothetical protein
MIYYIIIGAVEILLELICEFRYIQAIEITNLKIIYAQCRQHSVSLLAWIIIMKGGGIL